MLSIRTQDRMALVPYKKMIRIEKIRNKYHLFTSSVDYQSTYIKLGTYATKERALEVLDEIGEANEENNVILKEYFNGVLTQLEEYSFPKKVTYPMPKE